MLQLPNWSGRATQFTLLLCVLLLTTAGIATAAVAGDFTSSYDGYNDGSDTDTRGNEIQISGTLEFSGENAIDPQIIVRSSQHTVLDDESVNLLQPGSSSVNFDRGHVDNGVGFTADEIPSGTQLELETVVYPVSGLTQSEIKSAEVTVQYETPSGNTEEEQMDITTSLSNTPPQVISNQQQGQQIGLLMKGLAGVGGLTLLIVVVMTLFTMVKKFTGGGPPKRPGN